MSGSNYRILVVDDDPLIQNLVSRALEAKGHRVDLCPDGKSALEKISERSYDVLITDWQMPGMTGADLIEVLCSGKDRSSIILMSGYSMEDLIRDGHALSGIELLRKPFGLGDLYSAINRVLET